MDSIKNTSSSDNKSRRWQLPFLKKIKGFVQQGASPKALALSATIGLLLGVFPVPGVTTLAMTAISIRFCLNLPLMIALSYVIYPLQLLLIIPFVRLGEWLVGTPRIGLTLGGLEQAFKADFFGALADLGSANLLAAAGWVVLAVPVGVALYAVLVQVFRYFLKKKSELPQPELPPL